jgi:aerobic-type carbon monoxide dehydrogenase small subunit (CoxS/CutS family)
MVAEDLLRTTPHPTEEEIRIAVSANLCRCTGYVGIIQAITEVAQQRAEDLARQETHHA